MPFSKADCAVPTVDLAPMNSVISRIPTINAGSARDPSMNSVLDLLRNLSVNHEVNAI
nr:hypothetical protein PJ912_08165 [Pectobacterium colocasium]